MGEIHRDDTYYYFSLSSGEEPDLHLLWELERDEGLSGDLVAGLLVGLDMVCDDLEVNFGDDRKVVVEMRSDNNEIIEVNFAEQRAVEVLPDYFETQINLLDLVLYQGKIPRIEPESFGWFLFSPSFRGSILLYQFRSPEFIQGFISMCNAAEVDFNKYVWSPPFKLRGNQQIYYEIQGYQNVPLREEVQRAIKFQ